jgi:hypothetical protein
MPIHHGNVQVSTSAALGLVTTGSDGNVLSTHEASLRQQAAQ